MTQSLYNANVTQMLGYPMKLSTNLESHNEPSHNAATLKG
jgi:hypothetical protein